MMTTINTPFFDECQQVIATDIETLLNHVQHYWMPCERQKVKRLDGLKYFEWSG